jgi:hypothetical protein
MNPNPKSIRNALIPIHSPQLLVHKSYPTWLCFWEQHRCINKEDNRGRSNKSSGTGLFEIFSCLSYWSNWFSNKTTQTILLTIRVEVLANPSIIFMDEPTIEGLF